MCCNTALDFAELVGREPFLCPVIEFGGTLREGYVGLLCNGLFNFVTLGLPAGLILAGGGIKRLADQAAI